MKNKLIQQLKAKAKADGLSQEHLARIIGLSFQTINRWFNGKTTTMHPLTLISVKQFLKGDFDE